MSELEFERNDLLEYEEADFDRKVRKVVDRMLREPASLPSEYKAWLKLHLEQTGLQIPISQINGNFLVEDTTSKLGGNIHGRNGMIRAGATPYDFFQLSYDAVYDKWVSSFFLGAVQAGTAATTSTSLTSADETSAVFLPYEDLLGAGIKPQVRMAAFLTSDNASGTTTAQMAFETYDDGDSIGAGTASSWSLTASGTSIEFKESGWQDIPSLTTRKFMVGAVVMKTNNAAFTAALGGCSVWLRWVSV